MSSSAREVTTGRHMTAAAGEVATAASPVTATAAAVLGHRRACARQQGPYHASRQKKAPAFGNHDCHAP
jgi:hypothetical protein